MLHNYSALWQNPSDALGIFSIVGADIARGAIAQLVSSHPRPFTPVAFSFGWVAYSFSAILAAVGSRRLTPEPDCECTLIDVNTGYTWIIRSWVLARLVRDYESPGKTPRGLTVAFFRTLPNKPTGVPDRDWVYYSGVAVILLQFGIAAIPGALVGNWSIFILTFGGTLLVQLQAALPQWQQELWAARPITEGKREVVCLTRGNGNPYVIVVRSDGCGLRLADLAREWEVRAGLTVPATILLAMLWLMHLFSMQGVKNNLWYSFVTGGLGMIQNIIASGARRSPSALGFHLKEERVVQNDKVFCALVEAETVERKVGIVLTDTFFPGGLRPDEEFWKQETIERYVREKEKEKD